MAQLLLRNIDPKTLTCIKDRAKSHHRSVQGEVKFILEEATNTGSFHATSSSRDILKRIVGGWQGEPLTRSQQGDYEQRDELK